MSEEQATSAQVDRDWLIAQLEAWPTRVHQERTTSIQYLMQAAAGVLREQHAPDKALPSREELTKAIFDYQVGVGVAHEDAWEEGRGIADAVLALCAAQAQERKSGADRFWLIVREPGMVPDRKGPWPMAQTAKVLREFMAANPTAFIDYLTIGHDGTPNVEHGAQVLQYTDGRSMSVGRRHNAQVRAALASIEGAAE